MLAHLLDHFIFSSRRYTTKTKSIIFGICAGSVILTFWWFKGLAFGIEGPINEHKGLLWRKVSLKLLSFSNESNSTISMNRVGTSMQSKKLFGLYVTFSLSGVLIDIGLRIIIISISEMLIIPIVRGNSDE